MLRNNQLTKKENPMTFFSENHFDASKVDPAQGWQPIPNGKYLATIEKAEEKKTRSGDGDYLKLQLKIADGPNKGRTLYQNITLRNSNEKAQTIGHAQLSALIRATNLLPAPKAAHEFCNKQVIIEVTVRKNNEDKLENSIVTYEPPTPAPAPQAEEITSVDSKPWG